MSKAGVICEFNPFHNGHKFLFEKIKENYTDDLICVMSGAFVQRGDITITDKYSRATAALENGADMVVELPTVYAVSSANIFAKSGVQLAHELGCERLCFGAENSLEELYNALSVLDSPDTQEKIADLMKNGDYYPRAMSEAAGEKYADIISKPNNILALEYIRACIEYGMEPVAIQRVGVDHDDTKTSGAFASATKIREMIVKGEDYRAFTPMTVESPCTLKSLEPVILYKLKTASPEQLSLLADVSEGLENRIIEAAKQYNYLEEILQRIKTKRYTLARLRRIMIYALLEITAELQRTPAPYCRVLGVKSGKENLLGESNMPMIVKTKRDHDSLTPTAKAVFAADLRAAEAMNIARTTSPINEFTQQVIKL